jgi:hypothetical protein
MAKCICPFCDKPVHTHGTRTCPLCGRHGCKKCMGADKKGPCPECKPRDK